ncbi:hypothetical protein PS1_024122 [Malus domestica]
MRREPFNETTAVKVDKFLSTLLCCHALSNPSRNPLSFLFCFVFLFGSTHSLSLVFHFSGKQKPAAQSARHFAVQLPDQRKNQNDAANVVFCPTVATAGSGGGYVNGKERWKP